MEDYTPKHTPIEKHGGIYVKRDDKYRIAGICGGKVRACWHLATMGTTPVVGLITASARKSPQAQIVARLARKLGIPARLHMPTGEYTDEMWDVKNHGGEIIQHKAGYNNVIIARANYDADQRPGWRLIPFGMDHREAMQCTRGEAASIGPWRERIKRIIVPVGSGMTLAGILRGLEDLGCQIPVVGIRVGADPAKRLARYLSPFQQYGKWPYKIVNITKETPYHTEIHKTLHGIPLDPIYEAKCAQYLRPGDLFWIVGKRADIGVY